MRVRIGTSGYAYKEWKGAFYPADLAASRFFSFYAERFDTVEINATFYRLPTPAAVRGWKDEAPAGFTYAVKAWQQITHRRRLKGATPEVQMFSDTIAPLGPTLGPVLYGLPPNLKKDLPRLEAFLGTLPAGPRAAFEFRHASWFDDEVCAVLRARGAALCVAEADELATPVVATAAWGYLRLRREAYSDAELASWADRILAQPWEECFVYLKHEEAGRGPAYAARLREEIAKRA